MKIYEGHDDPNFGYLVFVLDQRTGTKRELAPCNWDGLGHRSFAWGSCKASGRQLALALLADVVGLDATERDRQQVLAHHEAYCEEVLAGLAEGTVWKLTEEQIAEWLAARVAGT